MPTARDIRSKIQSVKNTQKITRAMEMVAASKMRKAQDRMFAARPYAKKIRNVIGHLASSNSEYKHPYLEHRDVKRAGIICVTTDRGLCGGLNSNLLKACVQTMQELEKNTEVEIDLCVMGTKGINFFRHYGGHVVGSTTQLGDSPELMDIIGVVQAMLQAFDDKKIDSLYLVFNEFVNTMTQKPVVEKLLPIEPDDSQTDAKYWDYLYEPDAREVMEILLTRYIESQVYQGVVENIACEQAARMVAMKNATENAGDIIDDLQLAYNKARQAAITKELSEIIAGAEAV